MEGVTLDSGALIAFERGERRIMVHLKEAERRGRALTVPTVVVSEAWRGGKRSARIAKLFEACIIEPLDERLARIAGEALAKVPKATAIDAIVMASAARRGDLVVTSDFDDLDQLRIYFSSTRISGV